MIRTYKQPCQKSDLYCFSFTRYLQIGVSPKFVELCMEMPCLCPSEGHKHGRRKVTETSVKCWVLQLKRKIIALELRHIERNVSSSGSTVQLAKNKVITHLLTYAIAFSGRNFYVTQSKSFEIQTCSITIRRALSSWNIVKVKFL